MHTLKFLLDYVSSHQSQPHFSCLKSCLKTPVIWLTAVGPTNFSLQVNIFVVYSMKTKCFTGSQKYKVKQIWGFMTVMELFFLYESCWKDVTMLFHDRLWYLNFDFRYLKSVASGRDSKMPHLITFFNVTDTAHDAWLTRLCARWSIWVATGAPWTWPVAFRQPLLSVPGEILDHPGRLCFYWYFYDP